VVLPTDESTTSFDLPAEFIMVVVAADAGGVNAASSAALVDSASGGIPVISLAVVLTRDSFDVLSRARSGNAGLSTSSVMSHRHNCVSWPTELI
jgi:hypothetical protein